ncbi:hypothetical protein [Virgibacillus halodenitrificans]|uniref:hypothetical protein n=1 Tax=Virgibacillus halodenitrificans TaxID=1482 RepID=UPI000EF4911B|nr:hypothetical protein [Virgibacillus halodenitrificans]
MLKSLRLPLENGKYAYIEVQAKFHGEVEVHIIDRIRPNSGISVFECIEEIQEVIIKDLGASDFVMDFLQNSKWFLYSKTGKVGEFRTIGGVKELKTYHPELDQQLVKLAMERSGITPTNSMFDTPETEQLSFF